MKNMTFALVAAFSGVLFGIGMAISGMANPQKVIGFLDIFGAWDPSLLFVMGGALAIFMPSYRWLIKPRKAPVSSERFSLPNNQQIDRRLILGAAIFGLGWGLAGICPGPALASLTMGNSDVWIFVIAMVVGLTSSHRVLLVLDSLRSQR
ncbi:YeeE/YedE family protein [Vibrio tritonius]|uniref:YeeE/YedE family protein n=1 Tax=Vibrio tritonius TaxID=1435069 RepID=A0ABS7YK98_9VIBR|nr:YeeE/YedE family protein [Vibrio tritonius]MCA2014619.1 YeeE/YedE family protein [Vibrio tritonius]